MFLNRTLVVSVVILTSCFCFGQTAGETEAQNPITKGTLRVTKTVASNDVARDFATPLHCDAAGNVYSRSDSDGFPSIHKISPKGERAATFVPSSCSDIKVHLSGNFTVAPDGRLYQIVSPSEGVQPFVLVFDDDGTCHSKIKLDTSFSFMPYQLVVFPSSNMLISGMRWQTQLKQYVSYTALFSASGTILKDIDFESEPTVPTDASAASSAKQTQQEQTHSLSRGAMLVAADNNAYFMQSGTLATIYAISEGGAMTRHFRVDPGEPDLVTEGMQITGNRIAVLFGNPNGSRALIKVVDLEGKEVAQYAFPTRNGRITLPLTLACYTYPPEAFTFLDATKDDKVVLKTVEPR